MPDTAKHFLASLAMIGYSVFLQLYLVFYNSVKQRLSIGVLITTIAPPVKLANFIPDPVDHFEAPWWPFWIFEVLIEGMIESKNLFSES